MRDATPGPDGCPRGKMAIVVGAARGIDWATTFAVTGSDRAHTLS